MPYAPKPVARTVPRAIDLRPSSARRGYDAVWQRLREAVLADEPCCRRCHDAGRLTPATLVDHVVPINDGGERLDRDNLQSLCRDCHSIKTASDVRARGQT